LAEIVVAKGPVNYLPGSAPTSQMADARQEGHRSEGGNQVVVSMSRSAWTVVACPEALVADERIWRLRGARRLKANAMVAARRPHDMPRTAEKESLLPEVKRRLPDYPRRLPAQGQGRHGAIPFSTFFPEIPCVVPLWTVVYFVTWRCDVV